MQVAYKITFKQKYDAAKEAFIETRFLPTSAQTIKGLERAKAKAKAFADEMVENSKDKRYTLELVNIELVR